MRRRAVCVEQPGTVLVRVDDSHHVEHELLDVEIRPKVALVHRERDGPRELPFEPGKVLDDGVADGSRPIVELHRRGLHRAPVREPGARGPIEPVGEQRA